MSEPYFCSELGAHAYNESPAMVGFRNQVLTVARSVHRRWAMLLYLCWIHAMVMPTCEYERITKFLSLTEQDSDLEAPL